MDRLERLDALVPNGGIMAPLLERSKRRVVALSSRGYWLGGFDVDDRDHAAREHDTVKL